MRFLIIGDSWGCGEWRKVFITADQSPGPAWSKSTNPTEWFISEPVPDTDISYYLRKMGHRAVNIAKGGDSNINQLLRLRQLLAVHDNFDYIIWFHTEPVRDYVLNNFDDSIDHYKEALPRDEGYDEIVEQWLTKTYDMASEIYSSHLVPFVVIGGMTKLHPIIDRYPFARHKMMDWANDMLLEQVLPHPDNFGQYNKFADDFVDVFNHDRFVKEADESLAWIQHCFGNPRFPDWGHPDRLAHEDLAAWVSICCSTD